MKILVLTISDRAYSGVYEDLSGPAVEHVLKSYNAAWEIERQIVPDEKRDIAGRFQSSLGQFDAIITTGGTGLSPRDVTPEVTIDFCDRLVPGIAEMLRLESYKQTRHAVLSRAVAGLKGSMLIINIPGSKKAAEFCSGLLAPVIEHAQKMIAGTGH